MTYPGLFGDFDRLRRELDEILAGRDCDQHPFRCAGCLSGHQYRHTATSVEIYAFARGIDPKQIELTIDRGVLTISGDAPLRPAARRQQVTCTGMRFRRPVSARVSCRKNDSTKVDASTRDGVLHISV